jgi:hypothetical protein
MQMCLVFCIGINMYIFSRLSDEKRLVFSPRSPRFFTLLKLRRRTRNRLGDSRHDVSCRSSGDALRSEENMTRSRVLLA